MEARVTAPFLGDTATVQFTVAEDSTALALGSGDVEVLGTPKVVALCEEAAVAAIADHLPAGSTTVGTRIEIDHSAPTAVGGAVSATARVTTVNGRSISFDLSVVEGASEVASGRHTRAIVDRARFEARLRKL